MVANDSLTHNSPNDSFNRTMCPNTIFLREGPEDFQLSVTPTEKECPDRRAGRKEMGSYVSDILIFFDTSRQCPLSGVMGVSYISPHLLKLPHRSPSPFFTKPDRDWGVSDSVSLP